MTSAAFIQTIKEGDFTAFQSLLEESPELANSFDDGMQVSALLVAVYYGRREFVQHLLDLGVTTNVWEAAALGDRERVEEILRGEPELVNGYSTDGFTPLGLAAYFGYPDLLEFLIEKEAEVDQPSQNDMGVYPINSAAANQDSDVSLAMLKILLDHGAEVDAAQHGNFTALHEAALNGQVEKARLLLAAGADPERKADDGRTPIQMAREESHQDLVELLENASKG